MAKTQSVGGKEYPASDFAYVGDPEDIGTWHLPIFDADHVRAALARFNQTELPAEAKAEVARKLVAAAKKYDIDASGFMDEHKAMMSAGLWFGVEQAAQFLAEEAAGADDGYTWPVQIIEAGPAKGSLADEGGFYSGRPHVFTPAVVAEFAAAANGAWFGRRHPGPLESEDDPQRIAGILRDGKVVGNAARATLHLHKNEMALRDKLVAAKEAGRLFDLSVLAYVRFREDKDVLVSERLGKLVSVDLTTEAGAGGKFLVAASKSILAELREIAATPLKDTADLPPVEATAGAVVRPAAPAREEAVAAPIAAAPAQKPKVSPGTTRGESGTAQAGRQHGGAMKERILKVLETLRKFDAGRADELKGEFDGLEEDKHVEFLAKVMEHLGAVETQVRTRSDTLLAGMELKLAKMNLEEQIGEAKLPAEAGKLVREHLIALGRPWTEEETKGEIKRVREAFAAYSRVGRVSSEGAVRVGRDTTEKIQVAFDAMLGVKEAIADKTVRPFRGLREAFQEITGVQDHADFFNGGFYRVKETVIASDFPNILKNSMTKRLIQDYAEVGMGGVEQIISETDVADFKTQDRVRLGYYGDLPTVAENAAYLELTKPTDEIINYAVVKRGGFQDITWETILNDDLGKISSFAPRLARAARRTLKQFITDFFVNNPAFDPDALAWFHATHANLGSLALSSAELDARAIALGKQTEKDSLKRLGLPLQWIMVPLDLGPTAHQINTNTSGTNNWAARFGAADERIIVNELMTDVNDWVGGALPGAGPFLEIAFLQGFRTPQIFIVPVEQRRAITAIDKIQLYGIYVFGGDIVDFRPVFKNAVV